MKLFLSLALFAAFLLCPTACADGVREGLSLAAAQALPALFPFFVVSGLLVRCDTARLSPLLAKPLARLYGLPPEAAPALVLGLIGGYPVGAATACALLSKGVLSRALPQTRCGKRHRSLPFLPLRSAAAHTAQAGGSARALHRCRFFFRRYR